MAKIFLLNNKVKQLKTLKIPFKQGKSKSVKAQYSIICDKATKISLC